MAILERPSLKALADVMYEMSYAGERTQVLEHASNLWSIGQIYDKDEPDCLELQG